MAIIGFILCFLLMCYLTFAGVVMVIYDGIFGGGIKVKVKCGTVIGLTYLWYLLITNAPVLTVGA